MAWNPPGSADDLVVLQLKDFLRLGDGFHQRFHIEIRNIFFLIAKGLKLGKKLFGNFLWQVVAQRCKAL